MNDRASSPVLKLLLSDISFLSVTLVLSFYSSLKWNSRAQSSLKPEGFQGKKTLVAKTCKELGRRRVNLNQKTQPQLNLGIQNN